MGLVYLATPYSKFPGGPLLAYETAARVAGKMLLEGYYVYSPIAHTHPIATIAGIDPFNHDIWLPFDEVMMSAADSLAVATLPGWRDSYGVSHEIAAFKRMDKPIFYIDPDTLETSEKEWEL